MHSDTCNHDLITPYWKLQAAAWSILETARQAKVTPHEVIRLRSDLPYLKKLAASNGSTFARLALFMYIGIQRDIFTKVCKHCLLSDPSSYQGESTTLGILYSWEQACAAWGIVQVFIRNLRVVSFSLIKCVACWSRFGWTFTVIWN